MNIDNNIMTASDVCAHIASVRANGTKPAASTLKAWEAKGLKSYLDYTYPRPRKSYKRDEVVAFFASLGVVAPVEAVETSEPIDEN